MNGLSKFELSSATPVNVPDFDPSELMYAGFPRAPVTASQPFDPQLKEPGTIVILTHPDTDHTTFVDASSLLARNVLRVPHREVYVSTHAYPHFESMLYTRAAGRFLTDQCEFCTYAIVGTGTASSHLTAFLDEMHDNPALEALASYDTFEKPNWDGHGAQQITKETLDYARRIVRFLPDTFGAPDMAPSADGSIGLEWVPDRGPLTKLFMDIGPGKQWHAYWQRENGNTGRLSGAEIQPNLRTILRNLFVDLSM